VSKTYKERQQTVRATLRIAECDMSLGHVTDYVLREMKESCHDLSMTQLYSIRDQVKAER